MNLTVEGKQIDVGDALRTYVSEKLMEIRGKYFNRTVDAKVTFSHEGSAFIKVHISFRVGKDIWVQSEAVEKDFHAAFDTAAERLAKQLRRYKRRLRDHHDRGEKTPDEAFLEARDYTIAMVPDDYEEDDAVPQGQDPVVIAEMATMIGTMSVSEAVMRMDLSGRPALLFRNAKHNGLNMIYRRSDGNVGWVDPEESEKRKTGQKQSA